MENTKNAEIDALKTEHKNVNDTKASQKKKYEAEAAEFKSKLFDQEEILKSKAQLPDPAKIMKWMARMFEGDAGKQGRRLEGDLLTEWAAGADDKAE